MAFIEELQRRNVLRVGAAYAAGAWLLIEVAGTVFPLYGHGDGPARLVATLAAIGFIPALVLAWVFQWTPQGLKRDSELSPQEAAAPGDARARRVDRSIMVLLALALAVFAFDRFVLDPREDARIAESAREAGRSEALDAARGDRTLAVLPFVNMSGNPENEYFSDGLTETLLHMLAQLPDLAVTARTSSFAFKGETADIRDIGDALGVAHLLEGSVQRAGDRVRITAQLVRAEDGFHLWSKVYDRTLEDIFATQDEIASAVADALGGTLLDRPGLDTQDLSAYDLYLQGLNHHEAGRSEGLEVADARFRAALAQDPGFDDARVALARNNIFREFSGHTLRGTLMPESRVLLQTVLADQPDHLVARQLELLVQVLQEMYQGTRERRLALMDELVVALSEGFGDAFVRAWVVERLALGEEDGRALTLVQQGLETDPLNVNLLMGLAAIYRNTGRLAEARTTLLTAHRLEPENGGPVWELSRVAAAADEPVAELDWMRKALEMDPEENFFRFRIARALYDLGLVESAQPWHDAYLAADTVPNSAAWLEVLRLRASGQTERMVDLLTPLLKTMLTDEGTQVMTGPVLLYAAGMHELDRSGEALDRLRGLVPEFDVLGTPRGDVEHRYTVAISFPLRLDVADPGERQDLLDGLVAELDVNFSRWQDIPYLHLVVLVWQGDLAAAKQWFFQAYSDTPALDDEWRYVLEDPWIQPLRDDPEVAAALAEIERRRAAHQVAVAAMLQQPGWQP